jgi:high-affinity Fe2+/Pb2+ permease
VVEVMAGVAAAVVMVVFTVIWFQYYIMHVPLQAIIPFTAAVTFYVGAQW